MANLFDSTLVVAGLAVPGCQNVGGGAWSVGVSVPRSKHRAEGKKKGWKGQQRPSLYPNTPHENGVLYLNLAKKIW